MESLRHRIEETVGKDLEQKIFLSCVQDTIHEMYGPLCHKGYLTAFSAPLLQNYKQKCAFSLLNPDLKDIEIHRNDLDRIASRFPHLLDQARVSQTLCEDKLLQYLGQTCDKCSAKGLKGDHARRTKSMEIQIRSADEPATIIHVCLRPECQHTWNEN